MAEERIKRIADGIYKEVGGQENVDKVIHCILVFVWISAIMTKWILKD